MREDVFNRMLGHFLTQGDRMINEHRTAERFAPPDPWASIAQHRQVEATPEERFEDRYRAESRQRLAAEYQRFDALLVAQPAPLRLTTAEMASCAAPDPYERDLSRVRKNG